MDEIEQMLQGKSHAEKADIKAREIALRFKKGTYVVNGITLEVTKVSHAHGLLGIEVEASDEHGPLPVPDYSRDERFLFRNPPIRSWAREPGTNHKDDPGETKEDVENVVKGFLYDAVVTYARNHGWNG